MLRLSYILKLPKLKFFTSRLSDISYLSYHSELRIREWRIIDTSTLRKERRSSCSSSTATGHPVYPSCDSLLQASDHAPRSGLWILFAAFALIRGATTRSFARSFVGARVRARSRVYIRSAKRNTRNECAILIRRVKGTLREECGYSPRASGAALRHPRARERRSARMQHATLPRVAPRRVEKERMEAPHRHRGGHGARAARQERRFAIGELEIVEDACTILPRRNLPTFENIAKIEIKTPTAPGSSSIIYVIPDDENDPGSMIDPPDASVGFPVLSQEISGGSVSESIARIHRSKSELRI